MNNNIPEIADQAHFDKKERPFSGGWTIILAFLLPSPFTHGQSIDEDGGVTAQKTIVQ
jgi:hypothetical protein